MDREGNVRRSDATHHRVAHAAGIMRWHGFAASCMRLQGPAGVSHHGKSDRLEALRAEAEQWSWAWGSNPLDLAWLLAITRLDLATSHSLGAGILLQDARAAPSLSAVLRAWGEASARAIWLTDPLLTARQLVARALTELLEELKNLKRMGPMLSSRGLGVDAGPRQGTIDARLDPSIVRNFATKTGFELTLDRQERLIGVEGTRPDTLNLLQQAHEALPMKSSVLASRLYRHHSAAVHGTFMGWGDMVIGRPRHEHDLEPMSRVSIETLHSVVLHARAIEIWNGGQKWQPQGIFEQASGVALSDFMLAGVQLIEARKAAE